MRALHLPALLILMLALVLDLAPRTNAAPRHQQQRHDQTDTTNADAEKTKPSTANSHSCTSRAADVACSAAKTCGTLPVEDALRSVAMTAVTAHRASEALGALGFDTALDLELLGGGDAAAELLAELKTGRLGLADRAKVRLLVGDREHLWRLAAYSGICSI